MTNIPKDRRHATIRQLVKRNPKLQDNHNELVKMFWMMEGVYKLEDIGGATSALDIVMAYNDIRHQFEPSERQLERQKNAQRMWIDYEGESAIGLVI